MDAFEYRKIESVAPYNEFSISVLVSCEKSSEAPSLPGIYIIYLPVTTEEALYGVDIFGYPKSITDINFEDTAEARRCRVQADGKDILTLEVQKQVAEPKSIDTYTYSVKDNQLLITLMQIKGQ